MVYMKWHVVNYINDINLVENFLKRNIFLFTLKRYVTFANLIIPV